MNNEEIQCDEHELCIEKIRLQKRLLSQYKLPLVVISTHIPKELGQSKQFQAVFEFALNATTDALKINHCSIVDQEYSDGKVGKECTLIIKGRSASELKHIMITLENEHPLGSIMNLDVIKTDGKTISRSDGDLEPRQCLVCHRAASYCATNHRHSQHDIEEKINQLLESCACEDTL